MNWIFNLQKPILKLIFAGYKGSKNQVLIRLKIQFVELDFSELIFQKSSTDQQGEWLKSAILAKFQKGLEYKITLACSFKNEMDFFWKKKQCVFKLYALCYFAKSVNFSTPIIRSRNLCTTFAPTFSF